jgi:phosphopantetheine adenylyltransferase
MIQSRVGGRTSYNAGTRTTTDDLQVILYSKSCDNSSQKVNYRRSSVGGRNLDVYMIVFGETMHSCSRNRKKRWFHDVVSVAKEKSKKGANTKPIKA